MAPLWTNFTVSTGTIYYRVTNDSSMLQNAALKIRNVNFDLGAFLPSYAVVISWIEVPLSENENITVRYAAR